MLGFVLFQYNTAFFVALAMSYGAPGVNPGKFDNMIFMYSVLQQPLYFFGYIFSTRNPKRFSFFVKIGFFGPIVLVILRIISAVLESNLK